MDFELEEVKRHFSQLDEMAKKDYQTVTMRDLDLIDWLIEQVERGQQYEKTLAQVLKVETDSWEEDLGEIFKIVKESLNK